MSILWRSVLWAYLISAVLNVCLESALPEDPVHCCTFGERKNKLPIKLLPFVTEFQLNLSKGSKCVTCRDWLPIAKPVLCLLPYHVKMPTSELWSYWILCVVSSKTTPACFAQGKNVEVVQGASRAPSTTCKQNVHAHNAHHLSSCLSKQGLQRL